MLKIVRCGLKPLQMGSIMILFAAKRKNAKTHKWNSMSPIVNKIGKIWMYLLNDADYFRFINNDKNDIYALSKKRLQTCWHNW